MVFDFIASSNLCGSICLSTNKFCLSFHFSCIGLSFLLLLLLLDHDVLCLLLLRFIPLRFSLVSFISVPRSPQDCKKKAMMMTVCSSGLSPSFLFYHFLLLRSFFLLLPASLLALFVFGRCHSIAGLDE